MSSSPIKWTGWLAVSVNRRGYEVQYSHQWKASASLSVNEPRVGRDEIAVKIAVELPASLFERPQLQANITVPESQIQPLTIDLQTSSNIEDVIRQNLGFDVHLVPLNGKVGA